MTAQTISYDKTMHHTIRDFIMTALDPAHTLADAIRQGEITRENAAAEADAYMEHIVSLDAGQPFDDDDSWRLTTMETTDLERYILTLIDEIEAGEQ